MDHSDHVNLLRRANLEQGGSRTDLGAEPRAFPLALREFCSALTTKTD